MEVIEGMKFDQGALSRFFFTDTKTQQCVFEDPVILLSEQKITNAHSLLPILEKVVAAQRKLLIIAENIEGDALSTLILNKLRGLEVRSAHNHQDTTTTKKIFTRLTCY